MVLENKVLKLEPFKEEDFDYLYGLINENKYNKFNEKLVKKAIRLTGHLFWRLIAKEKKLGVVYTSYYSDTDRYYLDGYRDDDSVRNITNKISFSKEAGNLVTNYMLDHFTDVMWTSHEIENRAATILCKRMGYQVHEVTDSIVGKMITLKKEK